MNNEESEKGETFVEGELREVDREIAEDKKRLQHDEEERQNIEEELEKKDFTIIVNTRPKEVHKKEITYAEVVALAYEPNPKFTFTVAYKDGPKANPEGTMIEGDTVKVKDEMIFNVTPTDKS
jgi:hypothetical protein